MARITGAGLSLRTTVQATIALIFEVMGEGLRLLVAMTASRRGSSHW